MEQLYARSWSDEPPFHEHDVPHFDDGPAPSQQPVSLVDGKADADDADDGALLARKAGSPSSALAVGSPRVLACAWLLTTPGAEEERLRHLLCGKGAAPDDPSGGGESPASLAAPAPAPPPFDLRLFLSLIHI